MAITIHKREPVLTAATISGVVVAAIGVLVAFGVHVSKEQTAAIIGFVGVLFPLIAAALARRKVSPTR